FSLTYPAARSDVPIGCPWHPEWAASANSPANQTPRRPPAATGSSPDPGTTSADVRPGLTPGSRQRVTHANVIRRQLREIQTTASMHDFAKKRSDQMRIYS